MCDVWYHAKCCSISEDNYNLLANSPCVWICLQCGLPNFSNSLLNTSAELDLKNSFSSLSSLNEILPSSLLNTSRTENAPTNLHNNHTQHSKKPHTKKNRINGKLKIMTINCRSLKSNRKQNDLLELLELHKPDIVCGTESHLNDSINSSEVFPPNYEAYRKDRDLNGGGVFIAVKNNLIASTEYILDTNCEIIWAKLKIQGSKHIFIGSYYRPPSRIIDPLHELEISLSKIISSRGLPNIILTGDFNLPDINWNDLSILPTPQYGQEVNQALLKIAREHSFEQCNNTPTRGGNILDLFFTTNPQLVDSMVINDGMSDHDIVITKINMKAKPNRKKPRKIFLFKKGNIEGIKEDLRSYYYKLRDSYTNCSIEDVWSSFCDELNSLISKYIPVKIISGRPDVPWMTKRIKSMLRHKQRLFNRARKTKKEEDKSAFRRLRKLIKTELSKSHKGYINDLLDLGPITELNPKPSITKRFWSYIKGRRKDNVGIPTLRVGDLEYEDSKSKANILNEQFQSVFTTETVSNIPYKEPITLRSLVENISFDTKGIETLLGNLQSKKACGPDLLPTRILKEASAEIAPILQRIFQKSLKDGDLPRDWLTANIVSIHKKDKKNCPSNYRPISLTSIPCKIMEHIIYHTIMNHLENHSILSPNQHGFRKERSCETQLINTIELLSRSLDKGKQIDTLILDFSKAFDSVPHQRLLYKLNHYGIRGPVLTWLNRWLTNRAQKVVVDGESSDEVSVTSGVPHCTVLGPLMFLLYINDIEDGINSNIRLYADDCLLFRNIDKEEDALKLQEDFKTLIKWSESWQMHFNPKKCYNLSIHRKRQPILYNYTIGEKTLQPVNNHPYLGVHLQSNLKWNHHINEKVAKAYKILGFLKRNLSCCPESVKEQAYTALVRPHLEYASTAWDPFLKKDVNNIEMVQRQAARFVKNNYKREPGTVTHILNDLHWPTLESRRKEARLATMYQATHGTIAVPVPEYITPMNSRTRQYHPLRFTQPSTSTDTYKHSFWPRTIKNWNLLPIHIIEKTNINAFKIAMRVNFLKE